MNKNLKLDYKGYIMCSRVFLYALEIRLPLCQAMEPDPVFINPDPQLCLRQPQTTNQNIFAVLFWRLNNNARKNIDAKNKKKKKLRWDKSFFFAKFPQLNETTESKKNISLRWICKNHAALNDVLTFKVLILWVMGANLTIRCFTKEKNWYD